MLGFDSCLTVDVEGRSGGMTVFWKDMSKCRVLNYTRNFINMIVEDEQWGEWRLTCYYGYPERSRRRAAWDLLRDLDIPIEGHLFTWIKTRGTPHVIEEKLDRAMASTSWFHLFPQINHSFRFENSWLKEPDLEDVVVEGWGGRENLEDEEVSMQYQELSERHVTLLIQEEGYWKQRAKMHWLQEGDMNTRFFHMSATVRSKKKKVTKLIAENGTEAHTQEELSPITKVEIQQALFQMHPAFYQRFWEQCSDDIFSAASTWLERGYFPTSLNETNMCLIPKCDNPTSMKDLRPISLCNVLYKMIAKVLANRLRCCIDKCVSQEQSAFVEGRSILDNALIATKVIHALKRKTQGRKCELTLKIDISKAYDKVDWGFLRRVMTKMGFTDVWIRWVMMCVVGRGDLHGVRICCGAPEVSHLLFADDCFLFCRANVAENPNSLVAKLLKARYFPRSSLFEAPLGYNPSFAWNSMWHARQILSLGCRWRIGSGDNICVMHDPWLRGSASRWVPSPQPAGVYQLSVRDLLHDNYKAWDIAKVRNLFSGDVAEMILETPLVSSVREDKVIWEEERNECYSVKSGYKLAMRYIICSDKYHVAGNWNGIWTAQAPHKARHLLWRVCRGCLPTRYRLLESRVECTLNCPVCDEEIEDELHIFFKCAVAQENWCAAGLSSVLHNTAYQQFNAMDRIFDVCSSESSDTVGRVAMLLWCIWHNRNDKLWNDNVQMPHQIGRYAFDAWNDWYSVHKLKSNSVSGTTKTDLVRWKKPALGWVKCNIDVAFVSGSGKTLLGLCFCDNNGQFMAGMTHWQQTVISSVEGEAWTLLLAMEEARHRGLDRVQFESDSKVLIDAIHMKCRGNSEFLSIVHDILSFMSSFLNFEVKFVRRQANSVAHTLARAANSWTSFHRFENIPLCIEHLIINEM
ncbi:hypothetical protein TSUD_157400 [Trifolium subterraneum]|uniref:Reverse transcriptase domain-containing protein n=1 Tax=Trifolium subterraneum TaxID=3900 RepID=A0A2Z6N6J1_TRISU|nr:hypothetical protein TSUD_157400 [Trifolium subterraneum]